MKYDSWVAGGRMFLNAEDTSEFNDEMHQDVKIVRFAWNLAHNGISWKSWLQIRS